MQCGADPQSDRRLQGNAAATLGLWTARSRNSSGALGDVESWYRVYAAPGDVYVWRVQARNAPVTDALDGLRFLRAAAMAQQLELDVRAIAVTQLPDAVQLDVVMTSDGHQVYALPYSAAMLAERVAADADLRARYPGLSLANAEWLELIGPADALDFWRAHATVWDDAVGLTSAYARGEGVYQGRADDGPRAKPWLAAQPPLIDDKPKAGAEWWVFLVAASAAAAAVIFGAPMLTVQRGKTA